MYSTYLAGSGSEANAVALDPTGNAYVTGGANAFQTTSGALNTCCTFVEKLSTTGSEVYGAAIGSNQGEAIAVDPPGPLTLQETVRPVHSEQPARDPDHQCGRRRRVRCKTECECNLSYVGHVSRRQWKDSANAIALGAGNVVYFGGLTTSFNLPVTAGVFRGTYGGGRMRSWRT